jgi:solute carrier family 35, member F5
VLLKKFCGEEGEKVDVQKLFGYLGLFSLIALWWLGNTTKAKLIQLKY